MADTPLTKESRKIYADIVNRLTDGVPISQQVAIVALLTKIYAVHLPKN